MNPAANASSETGLSKKPGAAPVLDGIPASAAKHLGSSANGKDPRAFCGRWMEHADFQESAYARALTKT